MFDLFIAILLAFSTPAPNYHGSTIHPIVRPINIGDTRPMTEQDSTGGDSTGGEGGHIPPR